MFDKHGLTNLEQLNTDLVSEDSYKKSRVKHATLYVQNQTGLKNIFKLVSLSNVSYFEGVARIPRTVLDEYREGIIVGSACADGEVLIRFCLMVLTRQLKLLNIMTLLKLCHQRFMHH